MFTADIEYATDVTIIKYRGRGSSTIILRDDLNGEFYSLDTYRNPRGPIFSDIRDAVQTAIKRAQNHYCPNIKFETRGYKWKFDKLVSSYPEHQKVLQHIYRDDQPWGDHKIPRRPTRYRGQSGRTPSIKKGRDHVIRQTLQW